MACQALNEPSEPNTGGILVSALVPVQVNIYVRAVNGHGHYFDVVKVATEDLGVSFGHSEYQITVGHYLASGIILLAAQVNVSVKPL